MFPTIKKKIASFLSDQRGTISKKNLINGGLFLGAFSVGMKRVLAAGAVGDDCDPNSGNQDCSGLLKCSDKSELCQEGKINDPCLNGHDCKTELLCDEIDEGGDDTCQAWVDPEGPTPPPVEHGYLKYGDKFPGTNTKIPQSDRYPYPWLPDYSYPQGLNSKTIWKCTEYTEAPPGTIYPQNKMKVIRCNVLCQGIGYHRQGDNGKATHYNADENFHQNAISFDSANDKLNLVGEHAHHGQHYNIDTSACSNHANHCQHSSY